MAFCKGHGAGFARTTWKSSALWTKLITPLQLFILDGKIEQVNENPRSFGDLSDHLVLFNHQVSCGAKYGVRDRQIGRAAHATLSYSPLLERRTTRCWLLGSTAAGVTGLSARPPPETRSSSPTSSSLVSFVIQTHCGLECVRAWSKQWWENGYYKMSFSPHLTNPNALFGHTGSSEALLKGQKPPFVLAAQLVDGAGHRVGVPALSEGFVVRWGSAQRMGWFEVLVPARRSLFAPAPSIHCSLFRCAGGHAPGPDSL